MENIKQLEAMGLELPTPAYLFGLIMFGIVGYTAYRYGKKTERDSSKWLGIALMLYPYAISETWQLYALGTALVACLYFFRN